MQSDQSIFVYAGMRLIFPTRMRNITPDAIDDEPAVGVKRLFSLMEITFRWLVVWKASLFANTKFQEQFAFTVKLSLIESVSTCQ